MNRTKGRAPHNKLADPTEASFNALYLQYKRKATKRNLLFSLNKTEFKALTKAPCYYCSALPYKTYKNCVGNAVGYVYNGVDRMNNKIGYSPSNSVACCWTCNDMKSNMAYNAFLLHITAICRTLTLA